MALRILGLVGILDEPQVFSPLWEPLKAAFLAHFPDATFEVVHEKFFPWEIEKIHAYGQRVLDYYDDGTPTLLLGYSMGGIVGAAITPRFQQTPIVGLVALASPLQYSWCWGYPVPYEDAPRLMNVTGLLDWLATPFSTYVGADRRMFFPSDHVFGWMMSSVPAEMIAKTAAEWVATLPVTDNVISFPTAA